MRWAARLMRATHGRPFIHPAAAAFSVERCVLHRPAPAAWISPPHRSFRASTPRLYAKPRKVWVCDDCGEDHLQWYGQCKNCKAWSTLKEYTPPEELVEIAGGGGAGARAVHAMTDRTASSPPPRASAPRLDPAASPPQHRATRGWVNSSNVLKTLAEVQSDKRHSNQRIPLPGPMGSEISRVLGGGLEPASLILIGGDPGIGKSTMLLQVAALLSASAEELAGASPPGPILYVSGEESAEQISDRADRLSLQASMPGILMLAATCVEDILEHIGAVAPRAVIIDSIQTVYMASMAQSAGSTTQVKECATAFSTLAHGSTLPIFLVGHVTKEGEIAGPKVLEHIMDVVLYLEGERQQDLRLLRGLKNRFGSTQEVGVFRMEGEGLQAVLNPSAMLMEARASMASDVADTVAVVVEGTRAILIEVQALVCQRDEEAKGPPARSINGVDYNSFETVKAVLNKYLGLRMYSADVHINVVGGVPIKQRAADLAIAVAVASSYYDRPIPVDAAFVGEIGLGGELRGVSHLDTRINEAVKLGFKQVFVPAMGFKGFKRIGTDIHILPCQSLKEVAKKLGIRKEYKRKPVALDAVPEWSERGGANGV